MRANLRAIADAALATSPERALLDAVGDLVDYDVFHNFVLVATYIAPPRVMKGPDGEDIVFHQTDNTQAEDRFQGKCGIVLKCGPLAFSDDQQTKFGGIKVKPGDWVMYRPSDGLEMFIKDRRKANDGLPVRLIEDTLIKGRVSDPSLIY